MTSDEEFEGLCRRLYRSLRDGHVDREAAFDVSAEVLANPSLQLDEGSSRSAAADVAAFALAGSAADARLAAAAREMLEFCFEPTVDDEPGWLAVLEAALDVAKADLRASGLPDTVRLMTWEGSRNVGVDAWAANSSGGGIFPEEGRDPVRALVAMAEDLQDAVMHSIWGVWPTCPIHKLGVHAAERDGAAVWWRPRGGHAAAQVGKWPQSGT